MRSAAYVVGLSFRRLRRRDGGALGAALGIAAAAAVLAGILVGATVAKDRSVAQAVDRLPAADRAVRASWFGVPAGPDEAWPFLDRQARAALAPIHAGTPVPIVLVREATLGGAFVGLAGVDGLAPYVLLRSGRMPRACSPERCEVLRLRGEGRLPDVPGLRVVQVGTATLRSRQLFGDFLAPTDNALADAELAPALSRSDRYHRPAPGPLVVAEGVSGLVSSPVLARAYRSYSWVQRLSGGTPRLWEIDALVGDADQARAELQARSSSWSLSLPTQELRAAEHDATVSGRRLLLVGGEAAALLVAFAVLAAGALRRDLASARRRLTWHGARRWQRVVLTATESTAVGLGGAAAGWVIGSAAGAVAASLAGAPVGAVLSESVLSSGGLLLGLAVAVLAALVIAVTVSLEVRRRGRIGPLEIAAGAAVVAVLAVLASGSVDAGELASGGAAPAVLLLLPGLVAFAAAVVASRFLPGAGRLLARRGARDVRLAGVSVARSPGAAGIAAAFLALAVGLAVLAVAYRSTLADGRTGPGRLRGAGRRRRPGGPPRARPGAPRRAASPVRRDPGRRGRVPDPPQRGERRADGLGLRRHRPRGARGGDPRAAALATATGARARTGSPTRSRRTGRPPFAVRRSPRRRSGSRSAPASCRIAPRSSSQTARSASSSSDEPTPTARQS